jgi:polyvinyl alcohol dehydrogenase (cytochrome)
MSLSPRLRVASLKALRHSNKITGRIISIIETCRKEYLMRLRSCFIACALVVNLIVAALATGQSNTTSRRAGAKSAAKNGPKPGDWPMYGRDLAGSHYNPHEKILTPATVGRLKPKWIFETGADVTSQPTVVDGVVYFGSMDGKEYAVDAKTGAKLWEFDTGIAVRTGASYADGSLYFVDGVGRLYSVDAKTGKQKWRMKLDPHFATVGTSSPIYHNGRVYVGLSSREEMMFVGLGPDGKPAEKDANYACCTFRGGVAAVDAKTGQMAWRFYTIPETPTERGKDAKGRTIMGPSGIAVWSTVSIHPEEKRLYLTTGNEYTKPHSKLSDSIVALDLDSGKVIWSYQAKANDNWNTGCIGSGEECGPDHDFGSIALSFKGPDGKRLIGAGAKSGWFFAVDPKDGKEVWKTEVGPYTLMMGGVVFGTATDGELVYVGISNHPRQGSVSALDGATGRILWKTLNPDKRSNYGPVTVTGTGNDKLVFAGSSGNFVRAYDAKDGKIVWEFDTGGAVGGGVTVVDGVVYVGSGYTLLRVGKGNNKLYAFSIDGK